MIQNLNSAQAFTTLLQTQEVSLWFTWLKIGEAFGEEGWKELARALQGRAGQGTKVSISKEALAAARRDNIKVVGEFGYLEVFNKSHRLPVPKCDWDNTWTRLTQISDMTEDEFIAECDQEERRRRRRRKRKGSTPAVMRNNMKRKTVREKIVWKSCRMRRKKTMEKRELGRMTKKENLIENLGNKKTYLYSSGLFCVYFKTTFLKVTENRFIC